MAHDKRLKAARASVNRVASATGMISMRSPSVSCWGR